MNYFPGIVVTLVMLASCQQQLTHPEDQIRPKFWAFQKFEKVDSLNPILVPDRNLEFMCPVSGSSSFWEERNVLNPTALVRRDTIFLIYRAQDNQMTSRLGLATSTDGLNFQKEAAPIFYPENDSMYTFEWPGGVEDPRIVESGEGLYIMTYTSYDGKTARLCLATSPDLRNWTKHGLVLGNGKYRDTWSKSGAIVARIENSRAVATKINGLYWMYFGDTNLFVATSTDLINWQVSEDEESGRMIEVLHPRPGYFDSRLVEPGPFALLKEEGILLIYNASNAANHNDPELPKFAYAAGQALFDQNNPVKLLDRTDDYFIYPDKPYERTGEVNEVCFIEGLVHYKGQWFLYYGTADSKIAVAISDQ